MMQKVRGLISAFIYFSALFQLSFSFPLRYFVYGFIGPFLSPVLGWSNDLVGGVSF